MEYEVKKQPYVHKVNVGDTLVLDSKEEVLYGSKQMIQYKKLVVPSAMRSIYWKCYGFPATENNEILTRNKIVCLLCKSQMIYNRNTSNLRMHLQNKHKHELETLELVQPMPSCKSGRADRRSLKKGTKNRKRDCDINPIFSLNGTTVEQPAERSLPPFLTELDEVTPLQAVVKEVTTNQSFTLDDGKVIADAVSEFIILDMQPPDIVEGKGFQRVIATLKSPCEIPSKNRLTDEFLPKIYETVKEQLKPEIACLHVEMALSVEDWESSSGDTYSTVSMHYVSLEDGELQTKILSSIFCSDADPLHWGAQFDAILDEWEIKLQKVKAVLVASDRDEVYDSLVARPFTVIPCLAHSLQSACISECFEKTEVVPIIKKCRALISLIHLNAPVAAELATQENLIHCGEGKWEVDNGSSWVSTFMMLENLLLRKSILDPVLDSLAATGCPIQSLKLSRTEWSILSDIIDVLSPFKVAMTTLKEETAPLISILKPVMQQLKTVHLEKSKFDSTYAAELKNALSSNISQRYKDPKVNETLDMACAVDPRFKNLPFMSDCEKDEVKKRLKTLVNELHIVQNSQMNQENRSPNKKPRLSGMEYLLGDLCVKAEMPMSQRLHLELIQFDCETPVGLEKSPIQYWKDGQSKFPNISKLALQFLCIPVCVSNHLNVHYNTKTATENLTPQLVHKLRFLHQNNVLF